MPECHKCEKNGKGLLECLKCKGPSAEMNASQVTRSGISMLSLDALHESRHENDYELTHEAPSEIYKPEHDDNPFAGLSKRHSVAIQAFFEDWIRKPALARDTIATRIANPELSNKEIAKKLRITESYVSSILLRFFDSMAIKSRRNRKRMA